MIKLVTGPADLKGFDTNQLYVVHRVDHPLPVMKAVATSMEEAHDAQEMLYDLEYGQYHISPPRAHAN